jgi:negative regulator of genetic competence, sporulation and motility
LKVVAEPSQVGMMDKLTTFKFLWFIKYTDMAISEMDDSDIQKILDNGGDCFIELVDEFESPEMFYDKPWGSSELRISFFSDKIIIHIN